MPHQTACGYGSIGAVASEANDAAQGMREDVTLIALFSDRVDAGRARRRPVLLGVLLLACLLAAALFDRKSPQRDVMIEGDTDGDEVNAETSPERNPYCGLFADPEGHGQGWF